MTEKDHEDFKNSSKCQICKKAYEKGEVNVKDHNHMTGKYQGTPYQECNLQSFTKYLRLTLVFM